ncbi:MAG: hypothetical protein EZS26_003397 [Candidatus Ordinivivax streblomastigis]|uniref:Glycoside hydrolase family 127 protein n=1 Tax=Candidatus Ordinivivax streblomastigis TaxID=2540710 RepID=A0A5M8NU78_9BACT|nr:MAG: hypothetical protein EZS26_003397 [Candidatus Ordinivivax streblomastigis]
MKQLFFIILLAFARQIAAQQDPYLKIKEKEEAFTKLSVNEIRPTGWMTDQLRKDLDGFVGHLDSIVPALIIEDDIYGKDRRTREDKPKNLGNAWMNIALLWWNSETQSNWWDGYLRTAFLLNDKQHIEKIKEYVSRILATQDEDGYLGIYAPDIRYNFDRQNGENGELWSKATLYRGLLAYYGFTKDEKVLTAVKRAVQNVMNNYAINASEPFNLESPEDGITHGLCFTDVLDQLYQLTHDVKYREYALFLYKDYSIHMERNGDIRYQNIMNPEYRLFGHAVHTHEHLRPLLVACYASGNPQLQEALQIYLNRLKEATTITGGPIGDEWILGRKADPTFIGYEYCTMQEMLDSYTQLIQKTGDIRYADEVEKCLFNAAMGARHPEKNAITYLKTDNSYFMNSTLNSLHNYISFKYSPAHQDVAVCCNPNAGRILPYYIHAMWLKDKDGFIASLLGGCEVNTHFGKHPVAIKEITEYPYSNRITFEVEVKKPVTFALKIRKPLWNKGFSLDTDYQEEGSYIVIHKKWSGKTSFTVEWKAEVEKHELNGETYFTDGALVLALPIEAVEIPKRIYYAHFQDFEYVPKHFTIYRYSGNEMPVKEGDIYHLTLYNPIRQKPEQKTLVPMGHTLLRQVTFGNK